MKFRKSFIACSAAISLAFSAGYAIATDTSSPSTNSKASPIPGSSLSTVSEVVEAFDENTFKKTVEEKLRAQVYAVVPFDGHDLYSVFTTKGTFTIDRDVELAFKGKAIDLETGKNVVAQHLKQVEEKIKSAITKRNAIDDFTSRKAVPRQVSESAEQPSNQQQPSGTSKLGGMPTEPLSNVRPPAPKTSVVELSPDAFAALKRQTYPKQIQAMAKEAHEQYPGVKALQERQAKELHQREVEASIENFVNKKVAEPTTEKTKTSSIDILKRMPEKMRRKLGPKFAPGLLLNVPDEQFVVYEPNADTEYRGTLTIGTDFTCRVCQSFHQLIPTLNAEGIKVRYMPYPRAEVISYDFPLNHTMDERIARIRTEPLSPHGQLITAAYCSEDNKAAYNELFRTKMLNVWPTHISKSCEGAVREFKFLGDLLFNKATPYMVWGDSETSKEQTGYIRGLLPSDRSIDDLLKRLES